MAAIHVRMTEEDLKDINPESELYKRAVETMEDAEAGKVYREYAQDQIHEDGETEFDDDAVVSLVCDGGAYVMAWVWVADEELYDAGYLKRPEEE